jgi:Pyruvate/2-oxoacid:ferredoxin oxidoreductase gamma subunit
MTPTEAEHWVRDEVVKTYPLGVLKDTRPEPWFQPAAPTFDPDTMLEILDATADKPARYTEAFPEHLHPNDVAIKLAGSGGDGAQTAALILAKAAINEGFDATHIPSYGPESRGGTSYADVHVARDEVLSPAAPEPHVFFAFNAPSLMKFGPTVAEGGIVVYDSTVIQDVPELRPGVRVYPVPCSEIALGLGQRIVKNIVALGALQAASGLMHEESVLTAIRIGLHSKSALIPVNEEAFQRGIQAIRDAR